MRKGPNPVVRVGRQAYQNSLELEDNPHPKGSEDHRAWARGWRAEKRSNLL